MNAEVTEKDSVALGGKALRTQVTLHFGGKPDGPYLDLLVYRPAQSKGRVPAFLGLNFDGNHTVSRDPGIRLARCWVDGDRGVVDHHATETTRGSAASRWPIEAIVARGYAVATACYGDIDPDFDDGWANGIHALFRRAGRRRPPRAERLGIDRRVGLGPVPRARLPRDHRRDRRRARRGHRPLAPRQDGAVGRRPGRAVLARGVQRLGRGRRRARPPDVRRDREGPEHALSALVRRGLPPLRRRRPRAAGRPAHAARARGAAAALRRERDRGPVGRSEGRVPRREGGRAGLPPPRARTASASTRRHRPTRRSEARSPTTTGPGSTT